MMGVDLNTVKELLGHQTITMTLRYAQLSSAHATEAVDKSAADQRWKAGKSEKNKNGHNFGYTFDSRG